MVEILKASDTDVELVAKSLQQFDAQHPAARCEVYRYNSASIRVRLIDEVFRGKDRGDRHDYAMQFFAELPNDTASQLSLLLCLTPGETSLLDLEFDDPRPSSL